MKKRRSRPPVGRAFVKKRVRLGSGPTRLGVPIGVQPDPVKPLPMAVLLEWQAAADKWHAQEEALRRKREVKRQQRVGELAAADRRTSEIAEAVHKGRTASRRRAKAERSERLASTERALKAERKLQEQMDEIAEAIKAAAIQYALLDRRIKEFHQKRGTSKVYLADLLRRQQVIGDITAKLERAMRDASEQLANIEIHGKPKA